MSKHFEIMFDLFPRYSQYRFFSQFLSIAKWYTLLHSHRSSIATAPQSIPDCYHYFYRLAFAYTQGIPQSHPEMKLFSPTEMAHGRHEQVSI